MPKMDGLTFLEMIAKQKPIPTIICSTLVTRGSSSAIDAMRMGAVDIVLKPTSNINQFFGDKSSEFVSKVRDASQSHAVFVQNIQRSSASKVLDANQVSSSVKSTNSRPPSKKIIAIGASTGGVQTLEEILLKLEPKHPPIVVTQHMPAGFTASFANSLNKICQNSIIKEAKDGDILNHGEILIAPGDQHLEIEEVSLFKYKVILKDYPKVSSHKPSVDVLFTSLAKEVKQNTIAFILTGMGRDGAQGIKKIKDAGGKTYAQDEKTSVVYGMPKVAFDIGAIDKQVALEDIATIINTI